MSKETIQEQAEVFEKLKPEYYKIHDINVIPLMEKTEKIFRQVLTAAEQRGAERERERIIAIIQEVEKVNDSNGRYNACQEILQGIQK